MTYSTSELDNAFSRKCKSETSHYKSSRTATNARAPTLFKTRVGPRTEAEKTFWPRLGSIRDDEVRGLDFGSESFRAGFRPGIDAVGYVAGCQMLRGCAALYHLPLAKAGWSALPDLKTRQDDLNADRYGGWLYKDGVLTEQPGCCWEMQRAMLSYTPHPDGPVSLVDRGIRVRLPEGYDVRAFEKDMHKSMRRSSLVAFASSPTGAAHFAKLGIDPKSVVFHTRYGFGSGLRANPAHEIYLLRPRIDFSRMAMLAERLVLAYVEGLSARLH